MVAEGYKLKQVSDWLSLEIAIQTAYINALVSLFHEDLHLLFNIGKELSFIDQDCFRAVDGL
jgi:hypothetical protein